MLISLIGLPSPDCYAKRVPGYFAGVAVAKAFQLLEKQATDRPAWSHAEVLAVSTLIRVPRKLSARLLK
jgi:hypothetical protein